MPMLGRIKISNRVKSKLHMVQPGTRDNDVLPSSGSSMSSGLSLDYSALNMGGIDNGVPFNHVDDGYVEIIEVNGVDDDDNKGRGSFVGSKEEGFALRHNLDYGSTANLAAITKKSYPDYPQYSDPEMYTQVSYRMPATPSFDLFNTYYASDEEYNLHSLAELKSILPKLVSAAQKVYDEWIQDEDDDDLNGGGICHLIADAMCEEMSRIGIECATVSYSTGEVHVASVAKLDDGVYTIDIDPSYYETGAGYTWQKIPDVVFKPSFISITKESSNPDDFPQYINEVNDVVVAYDEIGFNKAAFVKSAVTYDSNPVIQDLIKIPEVKALIDQEASGFVDQIIVTTTGADVQKTQQQQSVQPPGMAPIKLEPISGNPYGHVWISEDPTTHQKKPLDKIVRIDRVTDQWGTLVTILHEIAHHRHPDWSESQVEAEAESHAGTVKQFLGKAKNASGKTDVLFVKRSLRSLPLVQCDLADTYQKQVIGLQHHSSLRPHHGLLFTYSTQQPLTFWMGKVAFPIDIIFADANNQIVKIYRNCQPNSQELYTCDKAQKVIEVVGSYCAFHDINVGDHVFYADDEGFTQHILQKLKDIKIEQQKDLDMTDWNIKIVMKKNPDNRRFLRVSWTPEDYKLKKADIFVNPNQELISEALKEMPLEKIVRHALLHILVGAKNELPEDKEQRLITNRLY